MECPPCGPPPAPHRPVEQKGSGRALFLPKTGAGAQDSPHSEFNGFVLAKDQMLQIPFKIRQTRAFAPGNRAQWNARHAGHHPLHIGHTHGRTRFPALGSVRQAALPQANGSPGFIHYVNGLVRQQAITHMAR